MLRTIPLLLSAAALAACSQLPIAPEAPVTDAAVTAPAPLQIPVPVPKPARVAATAAEQPAEPPPALTYVPSARVEQSAPQAAAIVRPLPALPRPDPRARSFSAQYPKAVIGADTSLGKVTLPPAVQAGTVRAEVAKLARQAKATKRHKRVVAGTSIRTGGRALVAKHAAASKHKAKRGSSAATKAKTRKGHGGQRARH